jgi:MFS family permease
MSTDTTAEPDVVDEVLLPVTKGWIAALSLAMLGLWLAIFGAIQILLPRQIESVVGHAHKTAGLGWVTLCAGAAAIVACPIGGALSDRTTSRFGRRRPWIAGGSVTCAVGLILQSMQHSVLGIALCWILVQGGFNAMYAALSAVIPDQVPESQRGMVSALVGVTTPVALVLGTILASLSGTVTAYLTAAVLVVALQIPFALRGGDQVLAEAPPFDLVKFLTGFWISPREHPDFAWVFGGRFAILLGSSVGTFYTYFYLQDVLHIRNPEKHVATLITVYTVSAVLVSVVVGYWSDRTGRRKPFVIGASLVMAAAVVVFALGRDWTAVLLAGAVLGLGSGSYLAIDNALITQVLPTAGSRGRDLGVINLANTTSTLLTPAIAGSIVALSGGFSGLYFVTGGIILIGAFLILPVRSVR